MPGLSIKNAWKTKNCLEFQSDCSVNTIKKTLNLDAKFVKCNLSDIIVLKIKLFRLRTAMCKAFISEVILIGLNRGSHMKFSIRK